MPPFRFNIPFFSYGSPSRLSSGTSSPSPSPTPSRPPFRPGGIAQPSKPATSLEPKPKVPPSLSRVKSNVAAIAASSSVSQLPSSKKGQEQQKRKETEKLVVEENKNVLRKDMEESSKTAKEKHKRRETEKLVVDEKKKIIPKDMEENSKTAQEQQKRTEKLEVEEKKKVLRKDMEDNSKTAHELQKRKETEKLAVEEKKKVLRRGMEENSKTAQEQQKRKETEILAVEEEKKILRKDMEENSKTAQEQQKKKETEKLVAEERSRALKTVGREDATQSKTIRHIAAASESTRGPRDIPDRKTQNRTEIHTNDNHQKAKGESTSNHGNPRVMNREGSSSMSRRVKEDIREGISKLTWGKSNGDEKSVSVFTLTGENRGATMAIGSEKEKKNGEVHIRRGYRSNPEESPDTTATETEGGRRPFKDDEEDTRFRAYVNGNSQGVNNSIVCDGSVQENDPGIHMSLKFEKSRKKDETISPPANVAEKKPETETATEKLRNEPRVRRRCLRGLLAESSESEPENPLKPRRHGCRFTCKDKDIENI